MKDTIFAWLLFNACIVVTCATVQYISNRRIVE